MTSSGSAGSLVGVAIVQTLRRATRGDHRRRSMCTRNQPPITHKYSFVMERGEADFWLSIQGLLGCWPVWRRLQIFPHTFAPTTCQCTGILPPAEVLAEAWAWAGLPGARRRNGSHWNSQGPQQFQQRQRRQPLAGHVQAPPNFGHICVLGPHQLLKPDRQPSLLPSSSPLIALRPPSPIATLPGLINARLPPFFPSFLG